MKNFVIASEKNETRFPERVIFKIGTELSGFLTDNNIFNGKPAEKQVAIFVTMMTREELEASKKNPEGMEDYMAGELKKKIKEGDL